MLETPLKELRLDDALAAAAANARVNAMSTIDSGAADLDRALLSAAMRDHVAAAKFLISEERVPAENLSSARVAAASTSAQWCFLRWRDRKRDL